MGKKKKSLPVELTDKQKSWLYSGLDDDSINKKKLSPLKKINNRVAGINRKKGGKFAWEGARNLTEFVQNNTATVSTSTSQGINSNRENEQDQIFEQATSTSEVNKKDNRPKTNNEDKEISKSKKADNDDHDEDERISRSPLKVNTSRIDIKSPKKREESTSKSLSPSKSNKYVKSPDKIKKERTVEKNQSPTPVKKRGMKSTAEGEKKNNLWGNVIRNDEDNKKKSNQQSSKINVKSPSKNDNKVRSTSKSRTNTSKLMTDDFDVNNSINRPIDMTPSTLWADKNQTYSVNDTNLIKVRKNFLPTLTKSDGSIDVEKTTERLTYIQKMRKITAERKKEKEKEKEKEREVEVEVEDFRSYENGNNKDSDYHFPVPHATSYTTEESIIFADNEDGNGFETGLFKNKDLFNELKIGSQIRRSSRRSTKNIQIYTISDSDSDDGGGINNEQSKKKRKIIKPDDDVEYFPNGELDTMQDGYKSQKDNNKLGVDGVIISQTEQLTDEKSKHTADAFLITNSYLKSNIPLADKKEEITFFTKKLRESFNKGKKNERQEKKKENDAEKLLNSVVKANSRAERLGLRKKPAKRSLPNLPNKTRMEEWKLRNGRRGRLPNDINIEDIQERIMDGVKVFRCLIEPCNEHSHNFKALRTLYYHIRNSHGDVSRPFKCTHENCKYFEYGFKKSNNLKYHNIHVHNKDKIFKCEFADCESSFVSKYGLKSHVDSVHTSKRLFKCLMPSCVNKIGFKNNYSLQRHLVMVHFNFREFKCDHIDCKNHKGFKRQDSLLFHKVTVHSEIRPFKCHHNGCDRSVIGFKSQNCLQVHLKSLIHCSDRPYSCSKCDSTFKSKNNLKKHYSNKYGCKFELIDSMDKLWTHIGTLNEPIAFDFFKQTFCQFDLMPKPDNFGSLQGLLKTAADGELVYAMKDGSLIHGCLEIKTLASNLDKISEKIALKRWPLNVGYKEMPSPTFGIKHQVLSGHPYYSQLVRELHVLNKEFVILVCFTHGEYSPDTFSLFPALLQKSSKTEKYFKTYFLD